MGDLGTFRQGREAWKGGGLEALRLIRRRPPIFARRPCYSDIETPAIGTPLHFLSDVDPLPIQVDAQLRIGGNANGMRMKAKGIRHVPSPKKNPAPHE